MPYTHFELTGLNKVSFNVADDPFFKASTSKYFPECIVMNKEGEIKETFNPTQKTSLTYQIQYLDDFRDPKINVNDDKKIRLHLSQIKEEGTMILLTVRT